MNRLLRFLLLPAVMLLCCQHVAFAQTQPGGDAHEQETLQTLLYGYLLAATGNHSEAAALIGDIGVERQNSEILASAVKIAIQARNMELAKKYATSWVSYGGGTSARQTQAELHIISNELAQAERLLAGLMIDKAQTSADLFRQLNAVANKQQAVAMGRRLFPADAEGLYYLALLAFVGQQLDDADDIIKQALATDDSRLDILFLAGRIAQLVDGDAAPLALMQQFTGKGCANAVKHCTLDAVLWAFSDYLRNGNEWRDGLDAERADNQTWAISAGNWYEQWEMPQPARAAYQRGGAAFMAQLGLARLAEAEGDINGALAILQAADVENSGELAVRETTIAHLLSEQGNLDAALTRLDEAQKTLPDNFSLLYNYSLLLEQSGDIGAAVAALRRITELFPDNADGWNALGYVMADNNVELDNAKKYIERALQTKPNDPNIIDSLGWVNYRLGNLANARLQLQKAAEFSRSAEIYAHYGEVLWEMGDIGEAKRIWQQAKTFDPDNKLLNETIGRYQPF